ncbi:MAG: NAD(P)/FAD-dependent oxidoreductase [Myxococcales bacterium]|nr:NAD(P)/FAD-dependent oxidoreductase [Myxococcales bacterium]
MFDVVIVGGGPGGLQAALTLGRARRRVLLCDSGPRRNSLAVEVHNFVTRDGTPPDDFRAIARAQLADYPSVEIADARVESITGARGAFEVHAGARTVTARRILLATGMVDELLPIDGFRELWGHAIFQCPYCHGWEVRDQRWGFLALPHGAAHLLPFALLIRAWSQAVTVFTGGAVEVDAAARDKLAAAGVRLETAPVARLAREDQRLVAVELAGGAAVPCDVLFAQPPQRQLELVRALGLALDDEGFVAIDPMKRETSVPGIYAAGDLTTRSQAAVLAAAAGMQAAAALNVDLALDAAR